LFRALHRAGFANQAASVSKSDGLRLRDCYVAAAVRCAPPGNRPTPREFRTCQTYLEREVRLLSLLRVVVALGAVAMDAFFRTWRAMGHEVPTPKPPFRHGGIVPLPPIDLVSSYHPSQRNTQTGLLTELMFDQVFRQSRLLLEGDRPSCSR
jgi:uracil-DNA glycosylase family 4